MRGNAVLELMHTLHPCCNECIILWPIEQTDAYGGEIWLISPGWILTFMTIEKSLCNECSQEGVYMGYKYLHPFFFLVCSIHPHSSPLNFLLTNFPIFFFPVLWLAFQLLLPMKEGRSVTSTISPFIKCGQPDTVFGELPRRKLFLYHCLSETPFKWT